MTDSDCNHGDFNKKSNDYSISYSFDKGDRCSNKVTATAIQR